MIQRIFIEQRDVLLLNFGCDAPFINNNSIQLNTMERILAKGGFEFRIAKTYNGRLITQFRFKIFFFWSKWHDWFYVVDIESGVKRLYEMKEYYDGKRPKHIQVYP